MPLAALVNIRNPAAATTEPLMLRVNGNDLTNYVPVDSYRLVDMGFGAPQQFSFDVIDKTNAAGALLRAQGLVIWTDEVNNRCLYQGYIKDVSGVTQGPYVVWTVTCNDLSESLDYALPVIAVNLNQSTDQAQIQSLLGNYAFLNLGAGGFVKVLQGAMPTNNQQQMTTLRAAIETTLALTGVPNAQYYVDAYGRFHTLTTGDVAAPYAIQDSL
jgi:hypothetical protein